MGFQLALNCMIALYGFYCVYRAYSSKFNTENLKLYENNFFLLTHPFILILFTTNNAQILIYPIILYVFLKSDNLKIYSFQLIIEKTYSSFNFLASIWPALLVISWISFFLFHDFAEQNIVNEIRLTEVSPQLFKYILIATFVSPIVEEFCFRKILYRDLKRWIGIFGSAFVSSVLFALMHRNMFSFAILFSLGFLLCFVYEKSGSIKNPILVHSIFNFIMVLQIKL